MPSLTWLPDDPDWTRTLAALPQGKMRWPTLQALANTQVDFTRTARLDRRLSESADGNRAGTTQACLAVVLHC